MKQILAIIILMFMCGCSATAEMEEVIKLRVNSYTVPCVGEMEGECLLIQEGEQIGSEDWEYFYYKDDIEGFVFEPGYIYDLTVKKVSIANPPQDASTFKYVLVKIILKVKDEQ